METEKNGEQAKNVEIEKRKGTGEQYLFALIRCADWVEKSYKQLAEKNRANPEILKELYLCACDGVPVEKAIEALQKNPPEGALRFTRRKHLENVSMDEYQEQLSGIKKTTTALEKEVKQMSGMLQHIVEHVPDFDSMFPGDGDEPIESNMEPEQKKQSEEIVPKGPEQKQKKEDVPKSGTQADADENVPKSGTQTGADENVPKSSTKKRNIRFSWKRQKEPAEFIEKSIQEGYSNEQLEYLLDCMEEGLSVEKIERFASVKLPVDVMRRLRSLEERKERREDGTGQRS